MRDTEDEELRSEARNELRRSEAGLSEDRLEGAECKLPVQGHDDRTAFPTELGVTAALAHLYEA
ncbi:MAG: hypothetical protein ACRDVP_02265, partial [Acidimicrobiales bacterium]